ncbi:MAG: gamma-glutamyltransferase [Myxococcota bacterium]
MGAVATSEIQAARAGRDVLAEGGTAVDAAIAMAACLAVTEPTSNGLGGDLFALVHHDGAIAGLAANGASPAGLPVEDLRARHRSMPSRGWPAVTVPGQVSGWGALHARFGRMPWARLLEPAVGYAREGFTVGSITAAAWARALPELADSPSWRAVFTVPGPGDGLHTPAAGSTFRNPDLGDTLALLAEQGAAAFATELGPRIAAGRDPRQPRDGGLMSGSRGGTIGIDPGGCGARTGVIWSRHGADGPARGRHRSPVPGAARPGRGADGRSPFARGVRQGGARARPDGA